MSTDSQSSVMALDCTFPNNEIVLDIFRKMLANPGKNLKICWIKAHAGFAGNERADTLAKEAIAAGGFDIEVSLPYPVSVFNIYNREKIINDWQTRWQVTDKGRDTYQILNKVDLTFISPNRIFTYFASGHGSFPAYLFKIGKRNTDKCDCGERGSVQHFLFANCPLMPLVFRFDRDRTLRQNFLDVLLNRWNYARLCQIYNRLNELYSFIKYRF